MSEEIPKFNGPEGGGERPMCCNRGCKQPSSATVIFEEENGGGWLTYPVCEEHFHKLVFAVIPDNGDNQ